MKNWVKKIRSGPPSRAFSVETERGSLYLPRPNVGGMVFKCGTTMTTEDAKDGGPKRDSAAGMDED